MTFDEALTFFGTGTAIGEALGLSRSRVSQCRSAGGFSYPLQCVLEKESGGALTASRSDEPGSGVEAPPTLSETIRHADTVRQPGKPSVHSSSTGGAQ